MVLTLGSAIITSLKSPRPILTTGTLIGRRSPLSCPLRSSKEASGGAAGLAGAGAGAGAAWELEGGCTGAAVRAGAVVGMPIMVSESRWAAPTGCGLSGPASRDHVVPESASCPDAYGSKRLMSGCLALPPARVDDSGGRVGWTTFLRQGVVRAAA